MTKTRFTLTTLALSVMLMVAASAQAATLRAFVSSTGNDANAATNCAQANPCRTFAGAFPTVTAGGELIALDTAGYGPLTGGNSINKAITIATVPGATAFVVAATGTAGFTIAGGGGDLITLRNITFNGSNAANTTGIQHNSGKLEIEDCKFVQLTTGLNVTSAKASVINSIFSGNTTGLSVSGQGFDVSNPGVASTSLVAITGGSFNWNGTAIFMTNPGTNPTFNVWILGPSGQSWYTSFANNTNFITGAGTGCPCTSAGTYNGSFGNPK